MLELFGALTNVWLQSGVIAVCGMVAARGVRSRGATWSATVLRATWIGVALCAVLSMSSLASQVSQRALWNVSLPTTLDNSPGSVLASSAIIAPNAAVVNDTSSTRFDANRSETNALDLPMTPSETAVETTVTPNFQAQNLSILSVLLALWLSGSALLLMWFGVCAWQMRRVIRSSTRIEDANWRDTLRALCEQMKVREPRLLRSEHAQSPFLTGLFRPCIVLPVGEFGASQRFVLLHELTHLQRRDLWWNMAARLTTAVLWTQPALWILQRACGRVGEEVCDEAVVQQSQSPQQYAQCLLDLAESWQPARVERLIGAGVVPLRSALARRVQHILQLSRRSSMMISRRAHWAIGALMLGVVASSLFLVAVQTEAKPVIEPAISSTRSVDLSSPESAVRSFVTALNRKDIDQAAACVEGGLPLLNPSLKVKSPYTASYRVLNLQTKQQGDKATIREKTRQTWQSFAGKPTERQEVANLRLIRQNGAWKFARPFFANSQNDRSFLPVKLTRWRRLTSITETRSSNRRSITFEASQKTEASTRALLLVLVFDVVAV